MDGATIAKDCRRGCYDAGAARLRRGALRAMDPLSSPAPSEQRRRALIIGAGPAGLTAAYELATRTDIVPLVLERSSHMGGISRTVEYRGNRIDVGGHRFFSKSDRVMLLRERRSRIYYLRQFFDYPISLTPETLRKLGGWRALRIGLSYARSALFPIRPERNLEEFFINRFGRELYLTFFKSYTEKVWGTPCENISAAWGAQRVKGLSITRAVLHFVKRLLAPDRGVHQKQTETSLIEQFLYPKYGPGQMWDEVAAAVRQRGGTVRTGVEVTGLVAQGERIVALEVRELATGQTERLAADFVFSTMALRDLVRGLAPEAPPAVREIAAGLVYRDFITVGLLARELKIREPREPGSKWVRDNWIYIQEPDVLVGRLQIFNNWSPYLVADPAKVWIGLEYFCTEGDALWRRSDAEMKSLAIEELARIDILDPDAVLDGTVLRSPKTYPAYFGTYDRFPELRAYLDGFSNLFLVGRNGMHRYNNQDHSMLTAMVAVDNLVAGRSDKSNLWEVNSEEEYHEEK